MVYPILFPWQVDFIIISLAQVLHRSDSKNKMQKDTPAAMAKKTNADMTFEVVMAETVFDSQVVDIL